VEGGFMDEFFAEVNVAYFEEYCLLGYNAL
jgi:hypothetical protein